MISRLRQARRDERGQVIFEFLGVLPIILAGIVLCLQAYVTVTAYEEVYDAARDGARLMSLGRADGEEAARKALPDWLVEEVEIPFCGEGDDPDSGDCLPDNICKDNEDPEEANCLPKNRCVEDGEEKPWEVTCVSAGPGAKVTVKTEIPLLFEGAPLVIPVEQTVTMPAGGGTPAVTTMAVGPGGVSNEANRALGKKMAAENGWTGEEWRCLDELWQHESGWSHSADNPTSSAYGIPQALMDQKDDLPANYRASPRAQIQWGLDYISRRYGTPCDAWAFWKANSPHWY